MTHEAAEGGVQPGIIVGRHAILKRGTRGDFVNARRYLTIYRSLNKLLAQPVELITAIPLDPLAVSAFEEMLSAIFQFVSLAITIPILSSRLMRTMDN